MSAEDGPDSKSAHRQVDADSELRNLIKDKNTSALQKYIELVFGRSSLWGLFWYELRLLLFSNMPGALGIVLRKIFFKGLFAGMGSGVVIGRGVTLRHPHRIRLGDGVIIDDYAVLDGKGNRPVTIDIGPDCIIGRNTVLSCKQQMDEPSGQITLQRQVNISVNCTLLSETSLTIGEKVLIAGHCYIIAGGNHGLDRPDIPILDRPMVHKGGVAIASGSWLGASAVLLDGTRVGQNAVVAAGAVVSGPVEECTIVGGVPARFLRDMRTGTKTPGEG